MKITFLGGGNMANALIGGLLKQGYSAAGIQVVDPVEATCTALTETYGVRCVQAVDAAVLNCEVLILAVKPQIMREALRPVGGQLKDQLVISIAAGLRMDVEASIQQWLGGPRPLVRTMPNTPAMIQAGAIVLHASPEVTVGQRNRAETIMRAGGLTRWVDREELLDAVTAISGSGPAYFFLLMEALEKVAVELGLDPESARLLIIQTALGASRMAMESSLDPKELRERVTSPGGTTESALRVLKDGDFSGLMAKAVAAAKHRSEELSTLLAHNS